MVHASLQAGLSTYKQTQMQRHHHPTPAGVAEHGGLVVCNAHVKHIETQDAGGGSRRAVGVELADGRVFKAKVGPDFGQTECILDVCLHILHANGRPRWTGPSME